MPRATRTSEGAALSVLVAPGALQTVPSCATTCSVGRNPRNWSAPGGCRQIASADPPPAGPPPARGGPDSDWASWSISRPRTTNQQPIAQAATATATAKLVSTASRARSERCRGTTPSSRRSWGAQDVADAAHGVDETRLAGLAAQVHHVHVQGVRRRLEVKAPHRLEDLLAGQHLAGVGEEQLQQRVFGTGQVEGPAVAGDLAGDGVHPQPRVLQAVAAARGRHAEAQQRAYAGQEIVQLAGLDEVVVGARVQAGHPVADRVASGEHEHRERLPAGAQAAAGGQPVHAWHEDVEDGVVGLGPAELVL